MSCEMKKFWSGLTLLFIITGLLLAACGTASTPPPSHASGTLLDGKSILEQRCNVCHSLSYITNSRGTPDQWAAVVNMMKANGAVLSPQEQKILDDYLAKTFK
jgi:cytochrome c5